MQNRWELKVQLNKVRLPKTLPAFDGHGLISCCDKVMEQLQVGQRDCSRWNQRSVVFYASRIRDDRISLPLLGETRVCFHL
jgi:hypothetical protein